MFVGSLYPELGRRVKIRPFRYGNDVLRTFGQEFNYVKIRPFRYGNLMVLRRIYLIVYYKVKIRPFRYGNETC